MRVLHVIDANSPWVRSLADALPDDWQIRYYRIYHPRWLPGGWKDIHRLYRTNRLDKRREEIYIATPGWRRFNTLSTAFVKATLPNLQALDADKHVFLFTFPFYSQLADCIRRQKPAANIAYWAHDAFAYYGFPPGYIEQHENHLVPVCDHRFAMAPLLVRDYAARYPEHPFQLLCDAVSESFLDQRERDIPAELMAIRQRGRPIAGCIGQINSSYDWDLMETAASTNPRTQFVFVGNLFEEGEATIRIRQFFKSENVHWLGRIDHNKLPRYLQGFDICLNPLSVTDHNHRRDPLRIYDYLTTEAPIFSTDLDGVRIHREHVELFSDPRSLIERLGVKPAELSPGTLNKRRAYIEANTWPRRAMDFIRTLDSSQSPSFHG